MYRYSRSACDNSNTPGTALTGQLKQVRVADGCQTLGESGISSACEERLQWIERMKLRAGPTVKKAVIAHAVEESKGQVRLINLGR